jgi:hypothetical protein
VLLDDPLPIIQPAPGGSSLSGPHRAMTAAKCEVLLVLGYLKGFRPKMQKPAPLTGTLMHLHLAYHFGSMCDEIPPWFGIAPKDAVIEEEARGYPKLIDKADEMYTNWMYYTQHRRIKPVAVEHEFYTTVGLIDPGGPFPELDDQLVTCRTDLLFRGPDGFLYLNDYKTTAGTYVRSTQSRKLGPWRKNNRFRLSLQVALNLLYARHVLKEPIKAMFIERILSSEPWTVDMNVVKMGKWIYSKAPRLVRMAKKAEVDIAKRFRENGMRDILPTGMLTGSCASGYGPCEFSDWCCAETVTERRQILQEEFARR